MSKSESTNQTQQQGEILQKILKLLESFPRETGVRDVTREDLDGQIGLLDKLAARSTDPCLTAKSIALSADKVKDLFIQKSGAGHVFTGIECLDNLGSAEKKYVLFNFEAKPGVLCLVTPAFVAIVNMVDRQSVTIIDPYLALPAE